MIALCEVKRQARRGSPLGRVSEPPSGQGGSPAGKSGRVGEHRAGGGGGAGPPCGAQRLQSISLE